MKVFLFLFCFFKFTLVCFCQIELRTVYTSQVGVREATGKNDGPQVEKYLRAVHLSKGYPWCAAFVRWCLDSADIKSTVNAYSPTAQNVNQLIYYRGKFTGEPKAGDVFCLYFPSLGRIGHTGFYDGRVNSNVFVSVEGNTNTYGSREGDGVYRKYRSFRATFSISRW